MISFRAACVTSQASVCIEDSSRAERSWRSRGLPQKRHAPYRCVAMVLVDAGGVARQSRQCQRSLFVTRFSCSPNTLLLIRPVIRSEESKLVCCLLVANHAARRIYHDLERKLDRIGGETMAACLTVSLYGHNGVFISQ